MTREQEESAVLDELQKNDGFFTIFWATENQHRANALQRLVDSGQIVDDTAELKLGYPQCHALIRKLT
jgi:hypothetical protein